MSHSGGARPEAGPAAGATAAPDESAPADLLRFDAALRRTAADIQRAEAARQRARAAEERVEAARERAEVARERAETSQRRSELAKARVDRLLDLLTGLARDGGAGLLGHDAEAERQAGRRDAVANHRERLADAREQEADERERLADEREAMADERDRQADAREAAPSPWRVRLAEERYRMHWLAAGTAEALKERDALRELAASTAETLADEAASTATAFEQRAVGDGAARRLAIAATEREISEILRRNAARLRAPGPEHEPLEHLPPLPGAERSSDEDGRAAHPGGPGRGEGARVPPVTRPRGRTSR